MLVVETISLRMTNSILSKLIDEVSHGDYKRTQQEVSNVFLPYLYNRYIVHANDKYTYPNVYTLSMSPPYCFHKVNMFPDIIVLNPSTTFQTYDFISCEISCNCSHVSLHHPRKRKIK